MPINDNPNRRAGRTGEPHTSYARDHDARPEHAEDGLRADLVLEGGGVKGIAIVGALEVLVEAGYRFERVAGTSAGAITGSVVAAMTHSGESLTRLSDIAQTLDFTKLRDRGLLERMFGPIRTIVDVVNLVRTDGFHSGDYMRDWVAGVLKDLGVETFGDLRRHDAASAMAPHREYSFIAVTSDLSKHRLTFLPWDYNKYGMEADEQSVANAVRASASMPFIFRPARMATPDGEITLTDGGILSNYPITIFDRADAARARWPTIGIRLSARESARSAVHPVHGPIRLAIAMVETAMDGWDARNIDNPRVQESTVFVDTGQLSSLDFDIDAHTRAQLRESGREAARHWLDTHAHRTHTAAE